MEPTLAPSVALPWVPFMFARASKSAAPKCQPSARLTITLARAAPEGAARMAWRLGPDGPPRGRRLGVLDKQESSR